MAPATRTPYLAPDSVPYAATSRLLPREQREQREYHEQHDRFASGTRRERDLVAEAALEVVVLDDKLEPAVRAPRLEFEDFYRDNYTTIARALSATLGDVDLATEATDEAMVRVYVRWDKIRDYDNPAGWVYRVGLNWARSVRRRIGRALPFHDRQTVDAELHDPAPYAALRKLDVGQRSVVVCRLLLDWSVEETAAALHIKPGTVKSRLHRALAQLEQSLGEHA